jgi:large subunit ribosomal protein L15
MTINKRPKNSRQRGSHTHGWGAKKKHRGAGHRGGRGAAGSGKRGDAKKPSIWKTPAGKRGFISRSTTPNAPVTIQHLEEHKKTLIKEGYLAIHENNHVINLESAGYTKLLGTGKVKSIWTITTQQATPKAIEKISAAKGTVVMLGDQSLNAERSEQ